MPNALVLVDAQGATGSGPFRPARAGETLVHAGGDPIVAGVRVTDNDDSPAFNLNTKITVDGTLVTKSVQNGGANETLRLTVAPGAILDNQFSSNGILIRTGAGAYSALKTNLSASAAPTTTDDTSEGYAVGSLWIDTTNDKAYRCVDATENAAVWIDLSGGASANDLLDGAVGVYDADAGAISYGVADDFNGTKSSAWTEQVDANGSITATSDYVELKDGGAVAGETHLRQTIRPHVPFDIICHITRISTDTHTVGGLKVYNSDDTEHVRVAHFADAAGTKFIEHGNEDGSDYQSSGVADGQWVRLYYDGRNTYVYSGGSDEADEPTAWTLLSTRTDADLAVPALVRVYANQWNNTNGKFATYRFRHFRFRYL